MHRESPWKRPWQLMKDGDLWRSFYQTVASKTPTAVRLTKVKGHATKDMVAEGKVPAAEKEGNDEADGAADKGSIGEQPRLYHLARLFGRRQVAYGKLMARIHNFIIKVKKAEREKRQEQEKRATPMPERTWSTQRTGRRQRSLT